MGSRSDRISALASRDTELCEPSCQHLGPLARPLKLPAPRAVRRQTSAAEATRPVVFCPRSLAGGDVRETHPADVFLIPLGSRHRKHTSRAPARFPRRGGDAPGSAHRGTASVPAGPRDGKLGAGGSPSLDRRHRSSAPFPTHPRGLIPPLLLSLPEPRAASSSQMHHFVTVTDAPKGLLCARTCTPYAHREATGVEHTHSPIPGNPAGVPEPRS